VLRFGRFELPIPAWVRRVRIRSKKTIVAIAMSVFSTIVPVVISPLAEPVRQRVTNIVSPIPPTMSVMDISSGETIPPAKPTYFVQSGHVLSIQMEPTSPPSWVRLVTEGYGSIDVPVGIPSTVYFHAPTLPPGVKERVGVIQACIGDQNRPQSVNCSSPVVIMTRVNAQ